MGDGMAGAVAKGSVLRVADAVFNDRRRREELIELVDRQLKDRRASVPGLLKEILPDLPDAVLTHFREHIFNDAPPGWWPAHPEKDRIVLRGLRKALELAEEHGLDLDSYWVCAGPFFQTIATLSPREVKLLFLTPPMPLNLFYPSVPVPDEVWIACSEADARRMVTIAGYPVGDVLGEPTGEPRPEEELPDLEPGLAVGGVQVVRPKRARLEED